jgi:hypothetical protein
VESLQDVAFALAPFSLHEAGDLREQTGAGRSLSSQRGQPPAARAAVLRLGQLAVDIPQLTEIEIHPLRVLDESVVGLDVRGRVAGGCSSRLSAEVA